MGLRCAAQGRRVLNEGGRNMASSVYTLIASHLEGRRRWGAVGWGGQGLCGACSPHPLHPLPPSTGPRGCAPPLCVGPKTASELVACKIYRRSAAKISSSKGQCGLCMW